MLYTACMALGTSSSMTAKATAPGPQLKGSSSEHVGGCPQVSGWQGAQKLHAAESGGGSIAYKGMTDCFARTVREEGWQALFKVRTTPRLIFGMHRVRTMGCGSSLTFCIGHCRHDYRAY